MPTRKERAELRKQMAQAVAQGDSAAEVAERFGVSTETVKRACFENNVTPRKAYGGVSLQSLRIVKALQEGEGTDRISERFHITRGRVNEIVAACRTAGLI